MKTTAPAVERIAPVAWQTAVLEIIGPAEGAALLGALPAPWEGVLEALRGRYGETGGAGVGLRLGRAFARHALPPVAEEAGFRDADFRFLPWPRKMPAGLTRLAALASRWFGTEIAVAPAPQALLWRAGACPFGREAAVCTPWMGFLQEALYWLSGGHWFAVSPEAGQRCVFRIPRQPLH